MKLHHWTFNSSYSVSFLSLKSAWFRLPLPFSSPPPIPSWFRDVLASGQEHGENFPTTTFNQPTHNQPLDYFCRVGNKLIKEHRWERKSKARSVHCLTEDDDETIGRNNAKWMDGRSLKSTKDDWVSVRRWIGVAWRKKIMWKEKKRSIRWDGTMRSAI